MLNILISNIVAGNYEFGIYIQYIASEICVAVTPTNLNALLAGLPRKPVIACAHQQDIGFAAAVKLLMCEQVFVE